jgi:hypothetical protein
MKAMSKFWTALVIGVAVMAVTIPSWAGPLTTVSQTTFESWIDSDPVAPGLQVVEVGPLIAPIFDFYPLTVGGDGAVTTVVYQGFGDAAGLYVYVYQIAHFSGSSENKIQGMTLDILGPVITNPSSVDPDLPPTFAFQVENTGTKSLGDGSLFPGNPPSGSFFLPLGNPLYPGETTWIFGFFSPVLPTKVEASVINTVRNFEVTPKIYTPSPEPSMGIMFGLGLLGIPLFGVLRRRFMK